MSIFIGASIVRIQAIQASNREHAEQRRRQARQERQEERLRSTFLMLSAEATPAEPIDVAEPHVRRVQAVRKKYGV